MAGSTIGTPALGSAQDKTGQTLAQVTDKLKGVQNAAEQASKRMDALASGLSNFWQTQERHAEIARRMSNANAVTAAPGFWAKSANAGQRVGKFGGAVSAGVKTVWPAAYKGIQEASRVSHGAMLMENAGATPADIAQANAEAGGLSRKYKSVAQTDIVHMLSNMRSFVSSYQEAARMVEPLTKLRVILQAANPEATAKDLNETFDQLIHSAALGGFNKNAGKFAAYTDKVARAVNVYGGLAKPEELFDAARHAGSASSQWSADFIGGVLPGLIKDAGGAESAGKALSAFDRAVGGRIGGKAAEQLRSLGLLETKWVTNGNGKRESVTSVIGAELAHSDPDLWISRFLAQGLARKNITDPARLAKMMRTIFGEDSAQFVIDRIAQGDFYEGKRASAHKAKGLDAASNVLQKDLGVAVEGLRNQVGALGAIAAKPFLQPAIDGINRLSEAGGTLVEELQTNKNSADHFSAGAAALIGTGVAAAAVGALPATIAGTVAGAGIYASWAYREFDKRDAAVEAIFKDHTPPTDYSQAAVSSRLAARDMARARNLGGGFGSGFGLGRRGRDKTWDDGWALGVAGSSVAPGMLAFGFGEGGVSDRAAAGETFSAGPGALRLAPRRGAVQRRGRFSDVVPSLRNASRQGMAVTVTAEPIRIESSVRVEASSELVRATASAKTATREAKLSARASGPGSTGSTEFGNQH